MEQENKSTYDPNSQQAIIGDTFSLDTLNEIKEYFPDAKHAEGLTPEYDILIPSEEYGYPKIECKVCGFAKIGNIQYTKIPKNLFEVSESKYVRIKYQNNSGSYSQYYFKMSSLKKYLNKMEDIKTLIENDRDIILWPTHLLEGMYTKIFDTQELVKIIKNKNGTNRFNRKN